jgi:chromosome segregation ATPase
LDEITETMLNIRKELSYNTKHKDNIKEQIEQLETELMLVESKITNNKAQLKQLAAKIADC